MPAPAGTNARRSRRLRKLKNAEVATWPVPGYAPGKSETAWATTDPRPVQGRTSGRGLYCGANPPAGGLPGDGAATTAAGDGGGSTGTAGERVAGGGLGGGASLGSAGVGAA